MKTSLNRLRLAPEQIAIYRGEHVCVANRYGLMTSGLDGFYLQQTRFLSRFVLKLDGKPLRPVCANVVEAHSAIAYYLARFPAGAAGGPPGDEQAASGEIVDKGIEVQVNSFAGGGLHQDVIVTNRALAPVTVALDVEYAADFADLDEVDAGQRRQTAPVERTWHPGEEGSGELRFTYTHARLNHATRIRFAGGRLFDEGDAIRAVLTLPAGATRIVSIDVAPVFFGDAIEPWFGLDGDRTPHHPDPACSEAWLRDTAILEAGNTQVQEAWDRAVADLASLQTLRGRGDERFTPMAGIPKYTALFGRDTLVTGVQSALLTPATVRGSLLAVGEWTAKRYDDRYDAQPGKVLHQRQLSPLAVLGENPFLHYYGDYSAASLFILGTAIHFAHTGDREAFAAVRDRVFATLDWMDRDGDIDGDGFYEFRTLAPDGIKNQGWKDSGEAMLAADGSYVEDPIAVVEIQGSYYAAKQALAGVLGILGEHGRAAELMAQAAGLKAKFNEAFWLPEERYFALALGPDKQPVRSIACDPGMCLSYGIIDADKAVAVRDRLLRPDLFTGWGVRTLSSDHPAYNPLAYHLGTVWPVTTANICFGLKRYGFDDACQTIAAALFDATDLFDYARLPEVFGGHQRDKRHPHPGIYPQSCSPQAWSASAVVQVVQALAGLTPLAPLDTLVVDPALPDWLPDLTIRNLQVGSRRVSLSLHRDASGAVEHRILEGGDGLTVRRPDPLPEGQDRAAALFATLAS